ncbi:Acyltransferase [Ancylostoma ceylanicum]|uniref:Acyltransferase n=1 Tax=Ancylostoma ceylanicum TaxID=53326 RepID=A0A0D6M488_9BILA|nr:Acyltransferase [Ancylostoma ceylanicum]
MPSRFRLHFVERIFLSQWGSKTSRNDEYEELPQEDPSSTSRSPPRVKKRHSSGDLECDLFHFGGIIHREKSEIIDSKLHSTDEPPQRSTTVSVVVDDSIDFITASAAGIEAIIEDQVTSRFRAEQIPSWNLLTRTRFSFQYIRENRAKKGGICVANHTSPIDVMVLSCDNCYAMIGQRQGGILGFIQNSLSRAESHIWFERSEAADRRKVTQRLREHVEDENKLPIIIFPEGTCINNTSVMMFKKGSFEIGSTIYPIAMKYDSRLTDAFWNSSEQSYGEYLWRMMTSWAIICDVWYLPPMTREPGEDAIAFARRVKRAIAKKGGLVDLEWDGALKRERVSSKLIELQQKLYYDRLARTTTINNLTDEETRTDVLDIMQRRRSEYIDEEIDETDDDAAIIRKVSAYRQDLRNFSEALEASVEPDSKDV